MVSPLYKVGTAQNLLLSQ